jgi:uroporphyrinogen decarboxylase
MIMTRTRALVRLVFTISAGISSFGKSSTTAAAPTTTVDPATPGALIQEPLLLRAARGEPVERTPVWMMRQAGRHMQAYRDLVEHHPTFRERSETPQLSKEISLQPFRAYGADGVILFSDILTPLPAMGIDFSISEGGKIAIQPIQTRKAFERTMKRVNDYAKACSFVGQVLGELREEVGNRATVVGFVGLPFTLASYIVEGKTGLKSEFATVKRLGKEDPTLLHDILSLLAKNIADYACYQIESGAQVIQVFDSWAGHLDDDAYSQFAFPYQCQVIAAIQKKHPTTPIIIYMAPGKYSSGGKRLAKLADTGADIVSIDHTIDFATARSMLPSNFGIQGNLDPKVLRDGPIPEIRRRTEGILAQSGGRHHIMNLGHGIEPDTPESHAAFFVKTVQNYEHKRTNGHQKIDRYDV